MTYSDAVSYIERIPKFTKKNDLAHTRCLLSLLGDPEDSFRAVHIAGTNGKGTVSALLARALQSAGEKTGLFTSPHLIDIRERIAVDGAICTEEEFARAFEKVLAAVKVLESDGEPHPAYFEFLFAMGMVIFAEHQVSYGVIETGLGGRLDATNILKQPELIVLTSIGLDHTKYLGNTIEEIAGEKAGILKSGSPVVYDAFDEKARAVIRARCEELQVPYTEVLPQDISNVRIHEDAVDFSCKGDYDDNVSLCLPFPALYQARNGAVAYRAAERLIPLGRERKALIQESFSHTVWRGRMQQAAPNVYLDGAHNADGIKAFVSTVREIGKSRPVLLFSQMADKDCHAAALALSEIPWKAVVLTTIPGGGGHSEATLRKAFAEAGFAAEHVLFLPDIAEAYHTAKTLREENGRLFCAGSLYLIGELLTFS